MKLFIIISFILLLSGCSFKKELYKKSIVRDYEEIIARSSDLPDAPFQVQLKNIVIAHENHDQMQIFYATNLSMQDIILYYEQQMERLGWQLLVQSNLQDGFLCYSKPEKFCSIIIFENSLRLYVGNK